MSAAIKTATIVSSLALVGAAAYQTTTRSNTDFSRAAMAATEHAAETIRDAKPKLPSNYFAFTLPSGFKWSNAA